MDMLGYKNDHSFLNKKRKIQDNNNEYIIVENVNMNYLFIIRLSKSIFGR
jgi:hypothetical protein